MAAELIGNLHYWKNDLHTSHDPFDDRLNIFLGIYYKVWNILRAKVS